MAFRGERTKVDQVIMARSGFARLSSNGKCQQIRDTPRVWTIYNTHFAIRSASAGGQPILHQYPQLSAFSSMGFEFVTTVLWLGLCGGLTSFLAELIYNLYFHPLAHFPGPKVAAAGYLYEFWYDVIKDGVYLWKIQEMHEKYGPIVRINPRELHIRDSSYYSQIYAGGGRRVNKDLDAVAAFSVPRASLATVEHDLHRTRRGILGPYFSKRAVSSLDSTINTKVNRLCDRLSAIAAQDEIVDLDAAFAALTADIITQYFYGETPDYLGSPNFKFKVRDAIMGLIGWYHFSRFFPLVANTIKQLPIPVIRRIQPGAADLLSSQLEIREKILTGIANGSHKASKAVILEAFKNEHVPSAEASIDRLQDEGTTIIFAGTETTARALSIIVFHMLQDKDHLRQLRAELEAVWPSNGEDITSTALEKLPYLTGAVNEGLRLSHGPLVRLPRVATHDVLQYRQYQIPAGTPVSQSTYFVHMDPKVFPEPHSFKPSRWIEASEQGVHLENYLVSFTKGSRQCLGINMAYAEIYLTIANVLQKFDAKLVDTTSKDVGIHHIRLTGYPRDMPACALTSACGSMIANASRAKTPAHKQYRSIINSNMSSLEESLVHSAEIPAEKWKSNAEYLFKTIAPRISHYERNADDACIQAQIDVFGKDHVGMITGSLASAGNFGAVVFAQSTPERLPIVAYLTEMLSFYDDFEVEIAEMMGAKPDSWLPRDPKFDNAVWRANFKTALKKIITKLSEADELLGPETINTMKELTETPILWSHMPKYQSFEEYVDERALDIAWPSVTATARFGANLHLPKEWLDSVEHVFWPLYAHACCTYDLYKWDKDVKTNPDQSKIVSVILLLQRLEGLSVEQAKLRIKEKCFELEEEYLKRKNTYFKDPSAASMTVDMQKWFRCQEDVATGFAIYNATTCRHHPPYHVAYKTYFDERTAAGAQWYDNVSVAQPLLTGGREVLMD
ncbi:Cytochrome P450 monooxygenase TRI4 [Paramyrothecium foliicola]|nr:Cytochrome P450 monooxygenase TRI4 [Paramyrothecium foliicola]